MTTMKMTTTAGETAQLARPGASVWDGLRGWLRRAAAERSDRRAAETLASLDDYLLRDIGVTRQQAQHLARHGRD